MKALPTRPETANRAARIYEVHEFIRFRPNDRWIPVSHYRTVYHRDGRISREALAESSILEHTIRAFQGHARPAAGVLLGLFHDVRDAQDCAEAIAAHHGRPVQVCGTQLTVTL
ncbi:hypothetical protein [Candidatus Methylocalor cossyra]|uniref:Uncharacterized protein n=1 Tax=Candidatus Methylocalor cossyra TaxID=3108543 RepID=A0ABP1CC41_9GAMM